MVAMVAPSFPIQYRYPEIIGALKRVGFAYVVEVSAGAIKTNELVKEVLKKNAKARFITSPCPSLVRMIRKKYPDLEKYLALVADSPMVATAKIIEEKYPEHKKVFLGPCVAKKFEAKEDYPELDILVLTYKELNKILIEKGIKKEIGDEKGKFDMTGGETRLYPISGGLTQSGNLKEMLSEDELEVVSGWQNDVKALERFAKDGKIRLLDILFCDGGCVNGPGIDRPDLSLEQRREMVVKFWKREQKKE